MNDNADKFNWFGTVQIAFMALCKSKREITTYYLDEINALTSGRGLSMDNCF
ncbi:hypothetical protein BCR33DRAFT_722827 [Rhizoclosmatium globosum]|uniref:Uncharacterized protein n=1 Tax=Rhizoclosmatium globosum TaxID=329046 RepID=A0A1Y2BI02_9FUNG|nr:hypothetical protein BCR33DRAFT_722827 [Rhizoclosmatium globosum]|eukprot:ORY34424.1 hypothetical protein BCR33DRAFT_722827 [Rhizoclosmatium globosum]